MSLSNKLLSAQAGPRDFATTHWSIVLCAGREHSPNSAAALEELCRTYWYPLYAFVRRQGCGPEEAESFCTVENLTAPHGKMPLNTSGGNLAECYMHGLELVLEAARQIRGTSTAQVPGARIALVAGGPVTAPISDLLLSES